ncbi:hypothetical protein VTO42DRAFT_3357 [Malbranchea cinnamomea]
MTSTTTTPPVNYAILLFPGFQALDAFGPLDALNLLARTHKIELSIIGPTLEPVSTVPPAGTPSGSRFGQSVVPTHTYADPPAAIDVLLIPGGVGVMNEPTIAPAIELARQLVPRCRTVLTVCTGSHLLARTGLLDGRRATTNKMRFHQVASLNPLVQWVQKARWVVEDGGRIWTSSGVSAGIDAMLAFLETVYGREEVARLATIMEFSRAESADDDPFAWATESNL